MGYFAQPQEEFSIGLLITSGFVLLFEDFVQTTCARPIGLVGYGKEFAEQITGAGSNVDEDGEVELADHGY